MALGYLKKEKANTLQIKAFSIFIERKNHSVESENTHLAAGLQKIEPSFSDPSWLRFNQKWIQKIKNGDDSGEFSDDCRAERAIIKAEKAIIKVKEVEKNCREEYALEEMVTRSFLFTRFRSSRPPADKSPVCIANPLLDGEKPFSPK